MLASIRAVAETLGLDLYPTVFARGARQLLRAELHRRGKLKTRSLYSHHEEESVIADLVRQTKTKSRFCVDIGASDGVSWSNSRRLFDYGWGGLAIELDPNRFSRLSVASRRFSDVALVRWAVTPDNVVGLLSLVDTPKDFGVLSLDIDSYDYDVLDRILSTYRPAVICSEFNEKLRPPVRFAVRWRPGASYPAGNFYGHSLSMVTDLAEKHSYVLAGVEYNNAFLVPKELGVVAVDPLVAFQSGYVAKPERKKAFWYNDESLLTMPLADLVQRYQREFAGYSDRFECWV